MVNSPKKNKTHCKRGHEFTEENTYYQIKNGIKCRNCKKCRIINLNLNYHQNKERHTIWQRNWRANLPQYKIEEYKQKTKLRNDQKKLKVISHYSPNLDCVCCGESQWNFLSIDHIHNNGNLHKKQNNNLKGGGPMYHWIIKHNFPKGFQVLCMNCNFGKRMNKGICPHKEAKKIIPITVEWQA